MDRRPRRGAHTLTRLEAARRLERLADGALDSAESMTLLMGAELLRKADEEIADLTCELKEAYDHHD